MRMAPLHLCTAIISSAVVVVCAATDLRRRVIPNCVTYAALVVALALALALGGSRSLVVALVGAAMGGVPALLAHLGGALGGGDVKLLGALGALVGGVRVIEVTAVACGLALVWSLLRLVARGGWRRELPFGPALAAATLLLIGVVWGVR